MTKQKCDQCGSATKKIDNGTVIYCESCNYEIPVTDKASPRPWTYQLRPSNNKNGAWACEVRTEIGALVAVAYGNSKNEALENAALIVRAVNKRKTLIDALKKAQSYILTRKGKEFNIKNSEYFSISVTMNEALKFTKE